MERSKTSRLLIMMCVFNLLLSSLALANDVVVTETGNVGIGTNTPAVRLDVDGDVAVRAASNGNSNILFRNHDNSQNGSIEVQPTIGSFIITQNNGSIMFRTGNPPESKLLIANSGNVGIGTNTPGVKLDVNGGWLRVSGTAGQNGDPATRIGVYDEDNTGDISGWWLSQNNDGKLALHQDAVGDRLIIDGAGNVGIGTTTPSEKLHVQGYVCSLGSRCASDIRWKENIEPIEAPLDLVTQLRGVSYDWIDKSKGEGQQLGVIAQEVEEVFPQVVHTDSQGYKSVEYSKLVAPLIEAVKVLKDENDLIRAENENLKNEIEDQRAEFENRMSEIEKMLAVLKNPPTQ